MTTQETLEAALEARLDELAVALKDYWPILEERKHIENLLGWYAAQPDSPSD